MLVSVVTPIHHLYSTGNTHIDIILLEGVFYIRLVDYRGNTNKEYLIIPDSEPDLSEWGSTVGRIVTKAFRYCKNMIDILSLEDLSGNAIKILQLFQSSETWKIKDLSHETKIEIKSVEASIDELKAKKLLVVTGLNRYTFSDQFGHLRPHFDPSKNQHWNK